MPSPPSMPFLLMVPTRGAVAVSHGRNDPKTMRTPPSKVMVAPGTTGLRISPDGAGGGGGWGVGCQACDPCDDMGEFPSLCRSDSGVLPDFREWRDLLSKCSP
jgi:hypothetical protein